MSIILDTSILIADERGKWDADRFAEEIVGQRVVGISAITASEFLHGCWRAPVGKRRQKREKFFDVFMTGVEILPFDFEVARTHARLTADLATQGITIGAHDLLIAATCLHYDWELATLNLTEFSRIPGLRMTPTAGYRIPAVS
jgi:tRNA(fMet)-specific endonuclease VapC